MSTTINLGNLQELLRIRIESNVYNAARKKARYGALRRVVFLVDSEERLSLPNHLSEGVLAGVIYDLLGIFEQMDIEDESDLENVAFATAQASVAMQIVGLLANLKTLSTQTGWEHVDFNSAMDDSP